MSFTYVLLCVETDSKYGYESIEDDLPKDKYKSVELIDYESMKLNIGEDVNEPRIDMNPIHWFLTLMKLNDEQIENLTYSLYTNLKDFKQFNTGFTPEYEDIIKCLDYALKSLWFFSLAIYIHLGIVGLMKDSTPFVVYVIN